MEENANAGQTKIPLKLPKVGLKFGRVFTLPGVSPYDQFVFSQREARIVNPDGSVVFEMNNVEVPEGWDQVSVDILASKYFRKAGVPQLDENGNQKTDKKGNAALGPETSAKQWAGRLAGAWRHWGETNKYFAGENDADTFEDELIFMLLSQMASPNSPQHFNTGLFESYKIQAPGEGNWYFDEKEQKAKEGKHRYERSTANACFIQAVTDELVGEGSIMDLAEREARLFKAGSGSGTNFSNVRGSNEPLSGGGVSSGVMSFLRILDRSAGAIKSGGTTRRAAKMVRLDVDHPDIEEFIWCKVREEEKVTALIQAGFSSDFNGEAYDTVSFQNANNSVGILPGFMKALKNDKEWNLTRRVDGKSVETIKAKALWDQIAEAAHSCADPGLHFDDIINDWHTAANDGRIRGSNPCSEYLFLDDTACNLASLNLCTFFNDETQEFNTKNFEHAVRMWTTVLEITVSMSQYPSKLIAEKSYKYRTLGLGYANLGAMLMRAGIAYDSTEGRSVMGAITGLLTMRAYATSAELARAAGACEGWEANQETMARVLRNHRRVAYGNTRPADMGDFEKLSVKPVSVDHQKLAETPFANMSDFVKQAADDALQGIGEDGYRNMQVCVIAPTGTIGLQMGCDTTGIEPDFALVKFKKLAGGGYMKIVNSSVEKSLKALGYNDVEIKNILVWALGTASLEGATSINKASLLAKGLTETEINEIENSLPSATSLNFATDMAINAETRERLSLKEGSILEQLGFSRKEINLSSEVVCGHQTVEGAPDLKPEDLAVYDCANYCGDGTRTIAWEGHVKALGAVAGVVSGSVSKTINLPNEATVEDIQKAYEMSYQLGVKCCAVYRDGSKQAQVLSSRESEASEISAESIATMAIAEAAKSLQVGTSPTAFYQGTTPPKFKLLAMSFGPRWKFNVGGTEVFLRASEYPDGTLGEIFLDLSKEGSTLKGILTCFAIAVSHGLQYGVPLTKYVDAFVFHTFEPNGMVSGHEHLKMASSIVDAVFRILNHYYLGDDSMVQVKGGLTKVSMIANETEKESMNPVIETQLVETKETPAAAVKKKETGPPCDNCGAIMIRAGSCFTCPSCGDTSGCS